MKNRLLMLLRRLEHEDSFKNKYEDFWESYMSDYLIEEILEFPNYRFIIDSYNKNYSTNVSSTSIKTELKRMEADGIVMIGLQDGNKYATTQGDGPNFDEGKGAEFTTESIILTTKGKSKTSYFLYQLEEQRFAVWALFLSLIAILISLWPSLKDVLLRRQ